MLPSPTSLAVAAVGPEQALWSRLNRRVVFWTTVVAAAVAIAGFSLLQQPLLLGLALLLVFLALRAAFGVRWALLTLLVETSLLDHFRVLVHGVYVRPGWIVAVAALAFLAVAGGGSPARSRWNRVDLLIAGWLLLNGVTSLVFAPRPGTSFRTWISLLLAASAYFLIRPLVQDRVDRLIRLFVIFGSLVCAFGVMAYLLHPLGFPVGVQTNPELPIVMAYGTLWEADIFGAFSACLLVLAATWVITRFTDELLLPGVAVVVSSLALQASLGRAAWLSAAITLVLAPVIWRLFLRRFGGLWGRPVRILSVTGLVTVMVSLLFWTGVAAVRSAPYALQPSTADTQTAGQAPNANSQTTATQGPGTPAPAKGPLLLRLTSLLNPHEFITDPTIHNRLVAAGAVLGDWLHEPVFGLGTASFGQLHTDSSQGPAWISNILLRALHDTGLVGLALLLAFIIGLVVRAVGLVRKGSRDAAAMSAVLLLPSIALWIAAQGTEPFQVSWPWLLLGALGAIVAEKSKSRSGDPSAGSRPSPPTAGLGSTRPDGSGSPQDS